MTHFKPSQISRFNRLLADLTGDQRSCLIRSLSNRYSLSELALRVALRTFEIVNKWDTHMRYPGEDAAETATYMLSNDPKKIEALDKDPGTRKKAHILRRFYEVNFGSSNVHIDLTFPEPSRDEMWDWERSLGQK